MTNKKKYVALCNLVTHEGAKTIDDKYFRDCNKAIHEAKKFINKRKRYNNISIRITKDSYSKDVAEDLVS